MEFIKSYSRRSFVLILVLGAILLAATVSAFYLLLKGMYQDISLLATPETPSMAILDPISLIHNKFFVYAALTWAGVFMVFGIILWGVLRRSAVHSFKKSGKPVPRKHVHTSTASAAEREAQHHNQQRLFLHLLSVLQREGRLVDFFSEDLNLYEDAQIGGAVRAIHENCKKAVNKCLALEAVIDHNEGEEIRVEPGFDPNAIKLTGNVTGEPPFKGVLRHKGWRTRKLELPALSGVQDARIIAPAEVEIL
ncbi:MAG: DUF2760 domain-containing protein [Thermodesulfobacteriota bacterium]|nr:DUF2760 domain-containing protein [Thermodesulfobacteriota bacterium]